MDSILTSVKTMMPIHEDDENFDQVLLLHINTVFSILNQLGVGPVEGFVVLDKTAVWSDFITERKDLEMVKSYVYGRVKLLFDPPQNSFLVDSIKKQCDEFEWRLNVQVENTD